MASPKLKKRMLWEGYPFMRQAKHGGKKTAVKYRKRRGKVGGEDKGRSQIVTHFLTKGYKLGGRWKQGKDCIT